jgi:hypothetical protein
MKMRLLSSFLVVLHLLMITEWDVGARETTIRAEEGGFFIVDFEMGKARLCVQ